MSHTSLWVVGLSKRVQIPVESANTPLYNILKQFCEKYDLDPSAYELQPSIKKNNKALDLSLPFRLSGLTKNATVEVLAKQKGSSGGGKTQAVGKATLGLQLPTGDRYRANIALNISLWDALAHFEKENNTNLSRKANDVGTYQQPVLTFMNQSFNSVDALKNTQVAGLGLQNGGNALLRLTYVDSGKKLVDIEEELNAAPKVEEPKTPAPKPTPAPKVEEPKAPTREQKEKQPAPKVHELPQKRTRVDNDFDNEIKLTDSDDEEESAPLVSPVQEEEEEPSEPAPTIPLEGTVATDVKLYKVDESRQIPDAKNLGYSDKDFEVTRSEFARFVRDEQKRKEDSMVLKTKKIRDMEEQAKRRVYEKCVLRVRFPSGLILQGTFKPKNKVKRLEEFIKACISNPSTPFYLYVTPPIRRLDDMSKTLKDEGLLPAALINVALDKKRAQPNDQEPVIKEDLLQYLSKLPTKEEVPTNLKGTDQEAMIEEESDDADVEMEKEEEVKPEPPRPQPEPVQRPVSRPNTGGRPLGGSGGVPKWFRPQ